MLRFLPVVLVGTLCASAAFAAGVAGDVPAIAEFVFVVCLALFFAAVLAGTANAASSPSDVRDGGSSSRRPETNVGRSE